MKKLTVFICNLSRDNHVAKILSRQSKLFRVEFVLMKSLQRLVKINKKMK